MADTQGRAVVFVVTKEPLGPGDAFASKRCARPPHEAWSVEGVFERQEDARAYADQCNMLLYVDTFADTKLTKVQRREIAERAATGPPGCELRLMVQALQAQLESGFTLLDVADDMGGGFQVVPTELAPARLHATAAGGHHHSGSGAAAAAGAPASHRTRRRTHPRPPPGSSSRATAASGK